MGGSVASAGAGLAAARDRVRRCASRADPIPMSRSRTNEEVLIVRSAPAHLESKLRFWDFSVGQIAAAFAGIMLGVVWAKFLSPLHGMWGAMSGAYIAALPVIPVFVASQTEFDLCGLVVGAIRWRRLEGRYLPGAGETASGYLLLRRARRQRPDRRRGPRARAAVVVGRGARRLAGARARAGG